jgi:ATP-dependent helicase Lhr and Lhr-like helicase
VVPARAALAPTRLICPHNTDSSLSVINEALKWRYSDLLFTAPLHLSAVHPAGTVITRVGQDVRWWTWAGYRANATLAATLSHLTDSLQRFDDASLRLRGDLTREMWRAGTADAAERLCLPEVDRRALAGLKFSEALPERLAMATLAARLADLDSAVRVLDEPVRFTGPDGQPH